MPKIKAVLISVFAVSALPSVSIKGVSANEASATWRSTEGWPSEWNQYWPNEIDVSEDVCYYVFQRFYALDYEYVMWSPDVATTVANIEGVADQMDDYTYAAAFMYGHGCNYNEYAIVTRDFLEFYYVPVEHYLYWPYSGTLKDNPLCVYFEWSSLLCFLLDVCFWKADRLL